ncbi:unnamed protein product, partial [Prorocentrum cordatum]
VLGAAAGARALSHAECRGRTAREIVQTYKLDRVLSTRRGDPKLAAAMARNDAKLRARDRPASRPHQSGKRETRVKP